jgi:hypothetical protein
MRPQRLISHNPSLMSGMIQGIFPLSDNGLMP